MKKFTWVASCMLACETERRFGIIMIIDPKNIPIPSRTQTTEPTVFVALAPSLCIAVKICLAASVAAELS